MPSRFACAQIQAVQLLFALIGFFSDSSSQQQIPLDLITAGLRLRV